jgi:hypothetical protein
MCFEIVSGLIPKLNDMTDYEHQDYQQQDYDRSQEDDEPHLGALQHARRPIDLTVALESHNLSFIEP